MVSNILQKLGGNIRVYFILTFFLLNDENNVTKKDEKKSRIEFSFIY